MFEGIIGGFVLMLITQLLKWVSKKFADKEWGKLATHAFLLIVALIVAGFQFAWKFVPAEWAVNIVAIWGGAVLSYEVLVKTLLPSGVAGVKALLAKKP
jgi:uncharacterized protein YacL